MTFNNANTKVDGECIGCCNNVINGSVEITRIIWKLRIDVIPNKESTNKYEVIFQIILFKE